jgi:hypothetical protein
MLGPMVEKDVSIGVPNDFGSPGGTPIWNGKRVLEDLWKQLGRAHPPSVIYVFVEPLSMWKVSGDSGSGTNPFGHAEGETDNPCSVR